MSRSAPACAPLDDPMVGSQDDLEQLYDRPRDSPLSIVKGDGPAMRRQYDNRNVDMAETHHGPERHLNNGSYLGTDERVYKWTAG